MTENKEDSESRNQIKPTGVLDVLACMDYELQILSILSSIIEHSKQADFSKLDLRQFHNKIRQFSALEQSFAGFDWYKDECTIKNTKLTRFFFNNRIKQNLLGTGFLDDIFDSLYRKNFFVDPPPIQNGTKEFRIKKDKNHLTPQPTCVEPISELLNSHTNSIKINRNTRLHCNSDPSKSNPSIYERRIEETCELYKTLRDEDESYLDVFNGDQSLYLKGIESITSFPCVGTVEDEEHSGKTVIFFLNSFHFTKESPIDNVDIRIQIKKVFENMLSDGGKINSCIKECASIDYIDDNTRQTYHPRNPALLWTLFVQIPGDMHKVYLISILPFFTSPMYLRSTRRFILNQAERHIGQKLNWNVHLSIGDYTSIAY